MDLSQLPPELIDFKPELGLVLGSGLGFFADDCIQVEDDSFGHGAAVRKSASHVH